MPHSARNRPIIRPLGAYEPYPSTHSAWHPVPDQLILPLTARRGVPGGAGQAESRDGAQTQAGRSAGPACPPPGPRELTSLLTALLEVASGQRAASRVRSLLSEHLYQAIHTRQRTAPCGRYVLGQAHRSRPEHSVLETCATAHGSTCSLAVTARLEAQWAGWICTHFQPIVPRGR